MRHACCALCGLSPPCERIREHSPEQCESESESERARKARFSSRLTVSPFQDPAKRKTCKARECRSAALPRNYGWCGKHRAYPPAFEPGFQANPTLPSLHFEWANRRVGKLCHPFCRERDMNALFVILSVFRSIGPLRSSRGPLTQSCTPGTMEACVASLLHPPILAWKDCNVSRLKHRC